MEESLPKSQSLHIDAQRTKSSLHTHTYTHTYTHTTPKLSHLHRSSHTLHNTTQTPHSHTYSHNTTHTLTHTTHKHSHTDTHYTTPHTLHTHTTLRHTHSHTQRHTYKLIHTHSHIQTHTVTHIQGNRLSWCEQSKAVSSSCYQTDVLLFVLLLVVFYLGWVWLVILFCFWGEVHLLFVL